MSEEKYPFKNGPAIYINVSADTAAAIKRRIRDWDGENGMIVYEELRSSGRPDAEIRGMSEFRIRMAFDSLSSRHPAYYTNTPSVSTMSFSDGQSEEEWSQAMSGAEFARRYTGRTTAKLRDVKYVLDRIGYEQASDHTIKFRLDRLRPEERRRVEDLD